MQSPHFPAPPPSFTEAALPGCERRQRGTARHLRPASLRRAAHRPRPGGSAAGPFLPHTPCRGRGRCPGSVASPQATLSSGPPPRSSRPAWRREPFPPAPGSSGRHGAGAPRVLPSQRRRPPRPAPRTGFPGGETPLAPIHDERLSPPRPVAAARPPPPARAPPRSAGSPRPSARLLPARPRSASAPGFR